MLPKTPITTIWSNLKMLQTSTHKFFAMTKSLRIMSDSRSIKETIS
jgi:hypothetical protein